MATTTIDKFLRTLRDKNIIPQVDKDNSLNIKAPHGVLTETVIEQIKVRKEELIDYLRQMADYDGAAKKIPGTSLAPSYPLSSSQMRAWVMSEVQKGSVAYNIPSIIMLHDVYVPEIMEKAILSTIDRHEILRTVFREDTEGQIRQWVLPTDKLHFKLSWFDLAAEHSSVRYEKARIIIDADKKKKFDLAKGPLFRVLVFKLQEEEYLFYYNMHHLISDGWSMNVLKKDVFSYYDAYRRGEEPSLPGLNIQFKDFAVWQKELLDTEKFREHRDYWLGQFPGEIPVLDLFGPSIRPPLQTDKGHLLEAFIPGSLVTPLREICGQLGCSVFMGLIGSLKALFSRYTGQTDIITGVPLAGRNHADLHDQIGFYVNTLALRTRFNKNDCFTDLLKTIRKVTLEAYKHQDYPFDRLLEELKQKRDMSRSALFDCMIVLQNQQENNLNGGNSSTLGENIQDGGEASVKFDVSFEFSESGEGLQLQVYFNTDIYRKESIIRMIRHYKRLLEQLVIHPDVPLKEIDYLSAIEQRQLLYEFNDTRIPPPSSATINEIFSRQAVSAPDSTAIIFENRYLSYRELEERSNQLAHYMIRRGIKPQTLVAVCLANGPEALITLLGVLKAGAAYVPIDPGYPPERIRYILSQSGAVLMITHTDLQERIGQNDRTDILYPDQEQERLRLESTAAPDIAVEGHHLAYVAFTSGSDGKPRGIMVTHRSVAGLVKSHPFLLTRKDVLLAMSSLSFDAVTFEYWGILLNGGQLVLSNPNIQLYVPKLKALMTAHGVSTMWLPSELLHQMVDTDISVFSSLKTLFTGGDRLSPDRIKKLRSRCPFLRIINGYGCAESTVFSLSYEVGASVDANNIAIGRPIGNTTAYLLDDSARLVPVGIVGEIYLGGEGLAIGYLNRVDLTADKFIESPYIKGEHLYRTGDLGKRMADGTVLYLGRVDDQVRIRGLRVEPGEIEHALMELEGVRQAAVIAFEKDNDQKYLIGYIVGERGLASSVLKQQLLFKLPEYMVPSYFIQVDNIPLKANGRPDGKALPLPEEMGISDEVEYVAPRSPMEECLVDLFKKIFRKDLISVKDNFFELGGDSLKAILLSGQLRQNGYTVEVADILKNPVLEDLALTAGSVSQEGDHQPVEGEAILTPVQQWFLGLEGDNKHHYNHSVLLRGEEPIDEDSLERALKHLVTEHDALRMRFMPGNGWRQYNPRPGKNDLYLEVHDFRTSREPLMEMEDICQRLQRSVNLEQGPLVLAGLFRLSDGDRLLLAIHYLVADTKSWRILLEDLSTAYIQLKRGQKANKVLKTDAFLSWTSRQRAFADEDSLLEELPYWTNALAGSRWRIPVDMEGGSKSIKHKDCKALVLDRELSTILLTHINAVYNTDMSDLLLTALGRSVHETFGCNELLVGMEGHGRGEEIKGANVDRTVGRFTTFYPVLLNTGDTGDVISYLIEVKEHLRKVPDGGIGYGLIRYFRTGDAGCLNVPVNPDIRLNYLGELQEKVTDRAGQPVFRYSNEKRGTEIDEEFELDSLITVSAMFIGGALHMNFEYSRQLFYPATMDIFLQHCEQHLKALVEHTAWGGNTRYVTPSDLTYKGLTLPQLSRLNKDGNVEDIYELSPLQDEIYRYWMTNKTTTAYVDQMSYRLKGDVDIELIRRVYSNLVNRHAVLRTSFQHEPGHGPLQIVWKEVKANFRHRDLRPMSDLEALVSQYKVTDRLEGFDLHSGMQMRLTILELANEEYEFIWTYHQILMDSQCINLLIGEFFTIWHAWVYDGVKELDKIRPYVNYINWLKMVDQPLSREFWKRYLDGYSQAVSMPFKKDGQPEQAYIRGEEELILGEQKIAAIKELCSELDIAENTFIQGVWGYLLSRYNNTQDAVFGAVVPGRPVTVEGIEKMIGLFINTIPVRIRYDKDTTVSDLLKGRQADAIESMQHQYIRSSDISLHNELQDGLFDHLLTYERKSVPEAVQRMIDADHSNEEKAPRLVSSAFVEQTQYALTITVIPAGKALKILFAYDKNRFSPEKLARVREHLENTIDFFLESPDGLLSSFNYLSAEETHYLLGHLNNTGRDYSRHLTVVDMLERTARENPAAVAVREGEECLTYSELYDLSTRTACYLKERHGICPGDRIGLKLERSAQAVIILIGILKAGAAYLPLDATRTGERADPAFGKEDCRLIIDADEAAHINAFLELYREKTFPPPDHPAQHDLAYIIFASDGAAIPEGIMISHGNLYNYLSYCQDTYFNVPERNCIIPLLTSLTRDFSVTSLFGALISGGELVIYPENTEDKKVMEDIFYGDKHINFLKCTPDQLILIQEQAGRISEVSRLVVVGDELRPEQAAQLKRIQPEMKIYHEYGKAETTVGSLVEGRPISNTSVYVLDKWMKPVAAGVKGQLFIGGRGVARGYLNNDLLSGERFIDHPLMNGDRIFHTRDLGIWQDDGRLKIISLDNQRAAVPLSYNQLLYCGAEGIANAYSRINVYIEGFEKDRFLNAYYKLMEAFEILRVRIVKQGDTYVQEIMPPDATGNKIEFVEDNSVDINKNITNLGGNESPFDLANGEIMRWKIRYNDKGHAFALIVIHHIVTDNASNRRLQDVFLEYYQGKDHKINDALRYFEFVDLQRKFLASEEGVRQLGYWMDHLKGDGWKAAMDEGSRIVENKIRIVGERYRRLRSFCEDNTLFFSNFMLGVLYLFLRSWYQGRHQFLAHVAVNGLDIAMPGYDRSRAIGQFLNILPVKLSFAGNSEGVSLLKDIQVKYLEGRKHQQIPFSLIREKCREQYGQDLQPDGSFSYLDGTRSSLPENPVAVAWKGGAAEKGFPGVLLECTEYSNGISIVLMVREHDEASQNSIEEKSHILTLEKIMDSILQNHKI